MEKIWSATCPKPMPCCGDEMTAQEPACVASDPRHHHVFDLDIFFHAVTRAFATEPALLHAAEGRNLGGDKPGIDADHAGLQRFGNPPDAAEIAGVEIGGKTERRVVAERDDLRLILEAEYRRERSKGFLMRDQGIRPHVGKHSRLEEGPAERVA